MSDDEVVVFFSTGKDCASFYLDGSVELGYSKEIVDDLHGADNLLEGRRAGHLLSELGVEFG